jgi:hypothetical protein
LSALSSQHEFSQIEGLGEVVVGAELEPGGLVVERSAAVSMRIGMPLPEATMRLAISSAGGPGCRGRGRRCRSVDAQQFQRGVAVTGDVGRDRFQAQAIADGFAR